MRLDVEVELGDEEDLSPKDRFAESSTLGRAVYRLADEQRARSIKPSTHAYHTYVGMCGAIFVHKQTTHSLGSHKSKRLAKRGRLLLYTAAVGCVLLLCMYIYSGHCSG